MKRTIECEGGPYDGLHLTVVEEAHTISIPMTHPREYRTYYTSFPSSSKISIGIYRQDPIDRATFNWVGEE